MFQYFCCVPLLYGTMSVLITITDSYFDATTAWHFRSMYKLKLGRKFSRKSIISMYLSTLDVSARNPHEQFISKI